MWQRDPKLAEMQDLIPGRLYRLRSRNLQFGVWDGQNGFIGIRTKFGDRFLDKEYHWDYSKHHGTVCAAKDMGLDVPSGIELKTSLGIKDLKTGRKIKFDRPVADGGKGWVFIDTDKACPANVRPCGIANQPLVEVLKKLPMKMEI